jgi:hypothetical protein
MRFLNKIFPDSKFILLLRHPIVVSYATKKWCDDPILHILHHSITAYEIAMKDSRHINNILTIKYEDLISNPTKTVKKVYHFLELPFEKVEHEIKNNIDRKYFKIFRSERKRLKNLFSNTFFLLEKRSKQIGYDLTRLSYTKDNKCLGT